MTVEDVEYVFPLYDETDDKTDDEHDAEYTVHGDKKTWADAKAACEADGQILAVIHSDDEEEDIIDLLEDGWYWIGLSETC